MKYYKETKTNKRLTTLLHVFGLWPETAWKKSYMAFSFIFHFFTSFLYVLSMLNYVVTNLDNFDKIAESQHFILCLVAYIFKIINFYYYGSNIIECSIKLLEIQEKNRPNENIFRPRLDGVTKLICFVFCAANISYIVACLKTFLVKNTELPTPSSYPIDWQNNTLYFWIVYLHQVIGGFVSANSNMGMDSMPYYLMGMVAAQFEILNTHIQEIGINMMNENGQLNLKEVEKTKSLIKQSVYEHQQILELVADIEQYFSGQFFCQVFLSGVTLSGGSYQMTKISPSENLFQFSFLVGFMVTMITQMFLYTLYGDGILSSSDSLSNAVYSCNWYVMKPVLRKDLIILLERLKRKSEIIAGKLFPLNLSLFSMIINFAYRIYTVLKGID